MAETDIAAVTGATGFLGSHLCERLLREGFHVRGLARPTSDRGELAGPVEWYVGDVFDSAALESLIDDADVVFHLAGASLWTADEDTIHRVNTEGTRTLLDACKNRSLGRVIFTSTAGTRRPEEDGEIADESDHAQPIGAYQASKAKAEQYVDRYATEGGDAVTVHPTSIFGPGDEGFTAELLTMAVNPLRFAHLPGGASIVGVDDVVDGLLAAYQHGSSGEHYLLGGENVTYKEALDRIGTVANGTSASIRVPKSAIHAAGPIAELITSATGRRIFPFDQQMARLSTKRLYYTSKKAAEELGYTYEPIESHAPDALSWYRSR